MLAIPSGASVDWLGDVPLRLRAGVGLLAVHCSGAMDCNVPRIGIVRLRVQVAQWTDEQPDTELSRLPIPA